ncbi:MAG: sugar phosphate isomerase/epimerase [Verrucomicrobiales bacterium]|nr:sugar phosphate isomerase/epimerase [Verrucomicrobiales bacterium]
MSKTIKGSSVTISLVPQAKGGPFVFWGDLEGHCQKAAILGYDAVEIFAPSPEVLVELQLNETLARHKLKLAALGTGAGWVLHKWHLIHPDLEVRLKARNFISQMIDLAARFGAPAIIGSLQGRVEGSVDRHQADIWLAEALEPLGQQAEKLGVTLLLEPLNRYESNVFNRVGDTAAFLRKLQTKNIRILADLFHMNIEESNSALALKEAGDLIGHIHFVDSNRGPVGVGHIEIEPIAKALSDIRYGGYISAECLPWPDSYEAAKQTIQSYRRYFN